MKYLIAVFALLGVVSSAPFNTNGVSPAMRGVIMEMLKSMLNQQGGGGGGGSGFKFGAKPPPPPPMPFKPHPSQGPAFMQPAPPQNYQQPCGVGGYGGSRHGGYVPPMMNHIHCPPGPTSSDSCKDQKLFQALYCPDGSPRYRWVPPRNPWDSSIPDTVKDRAQDILVMKVNARPSRTPTPKEWELMSILGDPKDGHLNNPFAMALALLTRAADRHEWRKTSASSAFRSPRRSTRSRDDGLNDLLRQAGENEISYPNVGCSS